jgi:hypothetical protein
MYLYVAFTDPGYVTNEKLGMLNGGNGDMYKDDIERMKSYHDKTLQAKQMKQHSSSSSSATSSKHKRKEVCIAPPTLPL